MSVIEPQVGSLNASVLDRPSIVNDPFLTYTASSPCVAVHSSSTPASSSAVNDHSENSRGDIMRLLQLPRATTVGATYPER